MNQALSARDLASHLHLEKRARSWLGTCPACGYQRAFSIKPGRDQRPLLWCHNGCGFADLAEAVRNAAGGRWTPPEQVDAATAQAKREAKQAAALRLWLSATTALGTLAETYLDRRALGGLAASPALRFRGDTPHPEGGKHPAMIALVSDVLGEPLAAHRTYLAPDGSKAALSPPKASVGPIWGGAIRLDAVAPELVIGEGIESAASAGRLLGLPAWSAICAGNLASLPLPDMVRAVVIAQDADDAGRKAAEAAAARWQGEGRRVRIACPDAAGRDFNDLLRARLGSNHAA